MLIIPLTPSGLYSAEGLVITSIRSIQRIRKNLRKFGKDENVVEVWEEDGQDVWLEHWIEDFLDEDSGEVVPVQRHEWHRVAIEESPWRKEDEQTEAQEGEADEIPAEPEE